MMINSMMVSAIPEAEERLLDIRFNPSRSCEWVDAETLSFSPPPPICAPTLHALLLLEPKKKVGGLMK